MTGTDDDQTPEMPDAPEMSGAAEQPSEADADSTQDEASDLHLDMQCAILDAALPHAAFDGWTRDVLVQAAFDVERGLGIPPRPSGCGIAARPAG
jgi:hypothetical protein